MRSCALKNCEETTLQPLQSTLGSCQSLDQERHSNHCTCSTFKPQHLSPSWPEGLAKVVSDKQLGSRVHWAPTRTQCPSPKRGGQQLQGSTFYKHPTGVCQAVPGHRGSRAHLACSVEEGGPAPQPCPTAGNSPKFQLYDVDVVRKITHTMCSAQTLLGNSNH